MTALQVGKAATVPELPADILARLDGITGTGVSVRWLVDRLGITPRDARERLMAAGATISRGVYRFPHPSRHANAMSRQCMRSERTGAIFGHCKDGV
jgi:hypothetical protein